ncbi:PQQ-binding-like beta-propeller repeat protein [Longimonas sp.]|uniref:PQQ-binding-like beta-propeller repeat protein n=1 Tax=Longimonas sp. TaxID=2039626 RepID=UPI0039767D63
MTGCASEQESSDPAWSEFEGIGEGRTYSGAGPETGEEKWRFKTEDRVFSSPAIHEGTVYVGSLDGHLYAIE